MWWFGALARLGVLVATFGFLLAYLYWWRTKEWLELDHPGDDDHRGA